MRLRSAIVAPVTTVQAARTSTSWALKVLLVEGSETAWGPYAGMSRIVDIRKFGPLGLACEDKSAH